MKRTVVVFLLTLLAVITLLAAAPILGVILSQTVAAALHCQVDEGSFHPCLYGGRDIGGVLYDLFVLGWLMILTIPILFIALLTWVGVAISLATRRKA